MKRFGPLVDAGWLHEHVDDHDVKVIDFRWYLKGRNGRDEYVRGHIPGAVFVNLEDVTGKEGGGGRHPLPSAVQFQEPMRDVGLGPETKVVVYDDCGGAVAARLWFLLGYFGHGARAVLDGGLQAWSGPLTTDTPRAERGSFRAQQPARGAVLDFDDVRLLSGVPLIDARAGERYRGETEPVDPKAGHIPGALSAPFTENLDANGHFKSRVSCARDTSASGPRTARSFIADQASMRRITCSPWKSRAFPTREFTPGPGAIGRAGTLPSPPANNLSIRA